MQFKKFGKYSVIKKVASGGMADILLAISLSPTGFGRFVVIKKALSKFSKNQDFNEMFKNEAKVTCNLKHKNITPIYEFGVEKDQFFLTMEYISGKNLREFTKKLSSQRKEIGFDNIIYIIKEVASGLNYAHNVIDSNTGLPLGIIHRDVSPQNIMISFDGEIKIIDFGIAKIADTDLTKAGNLKGKFSYMSPEQAQGEKLDERTDVFCLGIILWELLTGKRLFASENEMASLKKVRNCKIPSAQKINPKIPTELNDIVMKALSKNKNLRYKTASRFERDLTLFLNKNYPEYSHYNLTFLIKTVYRKDVINERDRLKIYSSEFKKYINVLNLEKNMTSEINLQTIGISSAQGSTGKLLHTKTKSLFHKKTQTAPLEFDTGTAASMASTSYMEDIPQKSTQSETTFQVENRTDLSEVQATEKKTTPKINNSTHQKLTVINTQKLNRSDLDQTSLGNKKKKEDSNIITGKFDFKKNTNTNINNKKPLFNNYKLNVNRGTASGTDIDNYSFVSKSNFFSTGDMDFKNEKNKKTGKIFLKTSVCLALVVILVAGGYFSFFNTNTFNMTSSEKVSTPVVTTTKNNSTTISQNRKPKPMSETKKIFIRSTPSNAGIYVNNKFISKYTPYLITVSSEKSYNVVIKKPGYLPAHLKIQSGQSKNSMDVTLRRTQTQHSSDSISIVN